MTTHRPRHQNLRRILAFTVLWPSGWYGSAAPQVPDRGLQLEGSAPRRALVIGNASYLRQPLQNPLNDARAMQAVLTELGFQVDVVEDASRNRLELAIGGFLDKVKAGDVVVVHYSGHGMQIRGENYIVPVDFDAKTDDLAEREGYPVSAILEHLGEKKTKLNILILDACRNNPFQPARSLSGGGLAGMQATTGTYIAFATAPDKTADDNLEGGNGLFTGQLVNALRVPGLGIDDVFNHVRADVHELSHGTQIPWSSSSVIGTFTFNPPKRHPGPAN